MVAWFREGAVTFTLDGRTRRPFLSGLDEEEKRKYDGEIVFPTLMLNLFPDYAQYRVLRPLAPDRTRIVTEWLFEPATMARADFDPADAVEFINLIGRQDWAVCELVQKGVGSRSHRHGVYTPQETHAGAFKAWYLERLEADRPAGREAPAERRTPEVR
jgi:Rieske 2Fe-2S family protein